MFNLIPGFSLDGGDPSLDSLGIDRELPTGDAHRGADGRAFGYLFMAVGLAPRFLGASSASEFLKDVDRVHRLVPFKHARQSYAQAKAQGTLAGLTVADIMMPEARSWSRPFAREYSREVTRSKSRTHLVVADGQLAA